MRLQWLKGIPWYEMYAESGSYKIMTGVPGQYFYMGKPPALHNNSCHINGSGSKSTLK
jgi:hypothetical protein